MDGSYTDGSFGPTTYNVALPPACRTATTQVRFRAAGDDSYHINYWYVDTVTIY